MNDIVKYFTLILSLGLVVFMTSCKKDEAEEMYISRTGNLKVTILNGDQPFADKQVKFSNSNGNLLDILKTDANGSVNVTNLLEGSYNFSIDVTEPSHANFNKQFQVISGESREVTFQTKDLSGSLTLYLVDLDDKVTIKEDVNVGIAVIPQSHSFDQAFSNVDKIALAASIKYFGSEGQITFDNLPAGSYHIFRVKADTIEKQIAYYVSVRAQTENVHKVTTNLAHERLFKKIWTLNSATSYGETLNNFSIASFKFYTTDAGNKVEITRKDGVKLFGNFSLDREGYCSFSNISSNKDGYSFSSYSSELFFDVDNLNLTASSFTLYDPEDSFSYGAIKLMMK